MKKKYLIVCVVGLFLSLTVVGQPSGGILKQVSTAMSDGLWDKAANLFRLAVHENTDEAGVFFWTSVADSCKSRLPMALELGTFYKSKRNYEKAYSYYLELVRMAPYNISYLNICAELEVARGREQDAKSRYEKIISMDVNHLGANIFLGNYFFLSGNKDYEELERNFVKIASPTRMQYADYRAKLERVVNSKYRKAKDYLERVAA
ncbi:MAG: hypothetical protein RSA44_06705, partial [Bacteroides sp.]